MVEETLKSVSLALKQQVVCAAEALAERQSPAWLADDLPWRQDRTPYRILLAEFLLVRTHAERVAGVFDGLVEKYPSVEVLACASEDELSRDLYSLGLRKRVPLLIKAVSYVVDELDGEVPAEIQELERIPGIGPYTARAIAAFAFGRPTVPADVNILRFLSRLTGLEMKHKTKGSKELRTLLPLLSERRGGPSPESLLDFARVVCRSGRPHCEQCPLGPECEYYRLFRKNGQD